MELKKISLQNIRSYESQEIEFPKGSTLLSGDIGAGKTSILLAIEFALFGLQPGQRGSALLRNSANKGGATIKFEVDNKQVKIERTLKRSAKTISQDTASITIDGEKKELAVTELKNKILDLLSYPKEFSKKQNILYKFTVYTPQEQMKEIILQDSETRVNTLRHVFGVDKYKKILENLATLTSKLREEKRLKQGQTMDIENEKENIKQKELQVQEKQQSAPILEQDLEVKQNLRVSVEQEQKLIAEKQQEKNNLQKEQEKSKLLISTKQDSIQGNKKLILQLQEQIQELQKLSFDESQITKLQQQNQTLEIENRELQEKTLEISSTISSLTLKNKDNDKIKEKLSMIEICPTCMQDVNQKYKNNVITKLTNNSSENTAKIAELEKQKTQTTEKILQINTQVQENQTKIQELNLTKIKLQGVQEKQERVTQIETQNIALEKDIKLLQDQTQTLSSAILELQKYDTLFAQMQTKLSEALNQEKQVEIKLAELRKEITLSLKQIQELRIKITQTQQIQKQLEYITGLEDWLSKKFTPIIAHIEKNVMVKLRSEFSKLFSEWFSMLVSDNFHVRLDDNFTPIIEQHDYELDYAYLSGGERTAIALAYRLSLNQVINSLLSKIKTRDLVILDEPTDGFSAQQLDKMRDVLQELNVNQLIIVSHEQKIEGFVENVIKLRKDGGISGKE